MTLLERLTPCGIKGWSPSPKHTASQVTRLNSYLDYLTGRSLTVVVNNHSSSDYDIRASVPQGSVLGPTLWNIYDCMCLSPLQVLTSTLWLRRPTKLCKTSQPEVVDGRLHLPKKKHRPRSSPEHLKLLQLFKGTSYSEMRH